MDTIIYTVFEKIIKKMNDVGDKAVRYLDKRINRDDCIKGRVIKLPGKFTESGKSIKLVIEPNDDLRTLAKYVMRINFEEGLITTHLKL